MALEIIAEGGVSSLFGVDAFENRFDEGESGQLHIRMRAIPPGLVAGLNKALSRAPGLDAHATTAPGNSVVINFHKGLLPLAPIAGVLAIVFVGLVLALVLSWLLAKELGETLGPVFPIALLLGLGLVAWYAWRKQRGTT